MLAGALVAAGCGTKTVAVKLKPPPPTHSTSPPSSTSSTGATAEAAVAIRADQAAQMLAQATSTAATTFGNNNNGNYSGMTATALGALDPTLQFAPGAGKPYVDPASGVIVLDSGAGYTVTATSISGDTFSLGESATGTPTQTCTGTASGACRDGSW